MVLSLILITAAAGDAAQTALTAGSAGDKASSAARKTVRNKETNSSVGYLDYPDMLEGSGFVLEGLEEKGLDAKSYIQVQRKYLDTQPKSI